MSNPHDLLQNLEHLSAPQLRRLLTEHLTQQKLGLYWESSAIERDAALNANIVLPRLSEADSHGLAQLAGPGSPNLIIEGDNFDSLRLLKSTHAGKIRVIYIDPPYNTGNKDWVYNDRYVGVNDRWRHSQWLEFLYRRLSLAKDLLTQDGVIMVSINDENRARLELLMDEVFPGRRVGSFVWRVRSGGNDTKGALLSDNHEHVLVYANAGFEFKGGNRKFILCSSTEGTAKEPNKNICRNVCAARIRKVIESDASLANNSFAYLQLDKIAPGDAPFESDCAHAFQLLTLRLGKVARFVPHHAPLTAKGVKILLQSSADGSLTVLVHRLTVAALDALAALPLSAVSPRHGHLRVYSTRPETVRQHLQQAWDGTEKTVESLSLQKALLHGQITPRRKALPKATSASSKNETL